MLAQSLKEPLRPTEMDFNASETYTKKHGMHGIGKYLFTLRAWLLSLSRSQDPMVQGQQLRKRPCYSGHSPHMGSPHMPSTTRPAIRPLRSSEAKHKDRQNSHKGQGSLEAAWTTCFQDCFLMLKLSTIFAVDYKEKALPRTGCYEKRNVGEQEFFEV